MLFRSKNFVPQDLASSRAGRRMLPALAGLIGALVASAPAEAHAAVVNASRALNQHWFEIHAWVAPEGASPCASGGLTHLGSLAVLALLVIAALRFRHSTTRHRLDLARRMVEQGMQPPEQLLAPATDNDLRRGLVLVAAGVGLLLYGLLSPSHSPSAAGLIPSFIGVGYLLSHRFAGRRPPASPAADSQ